MSDTSADENILSAANSGDLIGLEEAIKAGANINAQDENGSSLILASLNGNFEIAAFLINNGIDVNAVDEYGRTALMYASKDGYIEIVDLLLKNKADINSKDNQGLTAILLATKDKKLEIIKLLIANGANPGKAQKIATENGFTQIANYFENLPIETPNYDIDLIKAAKNNNVDIVEKALIDGADIETKEESTGMTALMYAAQSDDLPMVELLLKNNVDIDAKRKKSISNGDTALMFACAKGNLEIVEYLVKKGANIDAETLFMFNRKKQDDIMELLVYGETNKPNSTALISASKNNHFEIVKFLLENHANVNTKSKNDLSKGKTALLFACEHGHFEIVKLL